jgi:hypothetical protein
VTLVPKTAPALPPRCRYDSRSDETNYFQRFVALWLISLYRRRCVAPGEGRVPSPRWLARLRRAYVSLQRRDHHLPEDDEDENTDDANNEKKRPKKGRLNLDLSKA